MSVCLQRDSPENIRFDRNITLNVSTEISRGSCPISLFPCVSDVLRSSGFRCVVFPSRCIDLESPALYLLCPDMLGAAEEVLPSLKKLGSRVLILREHCHVEGIESLSDKIQQASDEPLPPRLRANVTMKSPALYIYTSGTTGNLAFTSNLGSF